MSREVKAGINTFKELRVNGAILTLRQARKAHKCSECGLPIEPGSQYYEKVVAGGGLGSLKFPDYLHIHCLDPVAKAEVIRKEFESCPTTIDYDNDCAP